MGICKIIIFLLLWLLPGITQARDIDKVTAIISSDEQIFIKPLATFQAGIDCPVQTFTLTGNIDHDSTLMDRLLASRPTLIFALGAKAAYLAKVWTKEHQEIPVLFAMVLNWEQYHLLEGQSNMAGISNEVEPGNQFLSLSMFAPGTKRIGVIYNPRHSSTLVSKARKAATMLGLELIERRIDNSRDFRRTYRQLADQVDGMWILNDPVTYTLDNMSWLSKQCIKDQLICIGQGIHLAEVGIMLSVRTDIGGIGSQAASMARNILDRNQKPASVGVMAPLGTHITLNRQTAASIGISISAQAIVMANEVIE
jgi:ABC-type uncharacterized transport system substrate-binding protein